jgi:hypothetical protein
LSAFAIVYFRFPFRMFLVFWAIFVTLMLARRSANRANLARSFRIWRMLNTLRGPDGSPDCIGHRHLSVPAVLSDCARGTRRGRHAWTARDPMRFFKDILAPAVASTSIAALFVIQFIYGWNQYLWPLLVTTNEDMYPVGHRDQTAMISGGDSDMRMECRHGHGRPGHAAAGDRGHAHAEMVCQGSGGHGEEYAALARSSSPTQPAAPERRPLLTQRYGRRAKTRQTTAQSLPRGIQGAPTSPTGSSSSSSVRPAAENRPCCAWWPDWRRSARAKSRLARVL